MGRLKKQQSNGHPAVPEAGQRRFNPVLGLLAAVFWFLVLAGSPLPSA